MLFLKTHTCAIMFTLQQENQTSDPSMSAHKLSGLSWEPVQPCQEDPGYSRCNGCFIVAWMSSPSLGGQAIWDEGCACIFC